MSNEFEESGISFQIVDPDREARPSAIPLDEIPLTDEQRKLVEETYPRLQQACNGELWSDEEMGFATDALMRAARRYGPHVKTSFFTYAVRAAKNAVIDHSRKMAKFEIVDDREEQEDNVNRPDPEEIFDHNRVPHRLVENQQTETAPAIEAVRKAMNSLDERHQRALTLTEVDGYTLPEAAQEMGETVPDFVDLHAEAKERLKSELSKFPIHFRRR